MIKYLFLNQIKRANRYFRKKKSAKLITAVLFFLVFLLIASGIYYFFSRGFSFIAEEQISLQALLLYFYEIFFLILGAIIFFSSLVTGMFLLWKGRDDDWFIASPAYSYLPKFVFIKSLSSSSWPLFLVIFPTVLAMKSVFDISFLAMLFILLSFVFYFLFLSASALSLIIITAFFYRKLSKKIKFIKFSFAGLFIAILTIVIVFSICVWNKTLSVDVIKLFRANYIENTEIGIEIISNNFYYLPSHPMAMSTLLLQNNLAFQFPRYFLALFFLSSLAIFLWWKLSDLFLPLWQKLKEGGRVEASLNLTSKKNKLSYRFSGSPRVAIFKKEFISFVRNPRNLIWFSFLLFIWLIQVSINQNLARSLNINELDPSFRQTAIQSLQFVVATYFISAFVLRFVFPSFSSERRTLWILTSSPIDLKGIFYVKYLFFATFFLIFGFSLGYINLVGLNFDWTFIAETLAMFSVATLFIVALGLSLGAIFPNYDTDDPGVISTTLPGISLIILSLSYGTLGGLVIYLVQRSGNHFLIYLFIIFSILATLALLLVAPKFLGAKSRAKSVVS